MPLPRALATAGLLGGLALLQGCDADEPTAPAAGPALQREPPAHVATAIVGVAPVEPACAGFDYRETHASVEALSTEFLRALRDDDGAALANLALDAQEFRCAVWPHLPSSRPERGLTVDYVWGDLSQKSQSSLAFTRHNYRGRRLELRRVSFDGETTDYGPFVVHRESRLTVTDETGRAATFHGFGSVLVSNGRYKIFSYVVD